MTLWWARAAVVAAYTVAAWTGPRDLVLNPSGVESIFVWVVVTGAVAWSWFQLWCLLDS